MAIPPQGLPPRVLNIHWGISSPPPPTHTHVLPLAGSESCSTFTPVDLCPVGPSRFPPARSDGCDARIPSARRSASLFLLAGVCPLPAKASHVLRPAWPSCSPFP